MNRIDHHLALAVITLVTFAARVVCLNAQPLWWDEGYSMFFATRDFATMLARTAVDIHPPLYYALLQLWITFAGKSAVAVRLLSVAIGVATIPLLYALARKLNPPPPLSTTGEGWGGGDRVALIAALALALAPFHVYYSQEVRMYGLVTLLGLGSVYLFVKLLEQAKGGRQKAEGRKQKAEGRKQKAVAIAHVLVTAAALYTQYYAAFILAFEIIIVLVITIRTSSPATSKAKPFKTQTSNLGFRIWDLGFKVWDSGFVSLWLAIVALYLPWLLYAGPKLYTYVTGKVAHEAYPPLDPLTFLAQHLTAFSVGHPTAWTWLAWGSVVFVGLTLLGIIATTRGQGDQETRRNHAITLPPSHLVTKSPCHPVTLSPRHPVTLSPRHPVTLSPRLLVTLYLLTPLALGYLVNIIYPFHPLRVERLLLLAAPAFYLLLALGIRALWNRRALYGALALIMTALISIASLYDFYTTPRYPKDDYRPLIAEMQTLAQPGDLFLAIYPWQIGYIETYYAGAPLIVVETPSDVWRNHPAQMQRDLDARLAQNSRVWLPALQTLGRILEDALDAYLRPRAYAVIDTWFGTTRLELFARADDPPRTSRALAFANGVTLADWGVSTERVAAGQDIVRVLFDWGDEPPSGFNTSLRLEDARGNLWAQDDREIAPGVQRIGFAIPTGTPPGEYDLRATIYRAGGDGMTGRMPPPLLAHVNVVAPASPNLAAVPHRVAIDFANGARLVGYDDGNKPLRPGEPTAITLYWQATRARAADYVVTLQIQDARGNVFASAQAAPARGIYPPTLWQPSELVRDPQTLTLRGDTPDGDYRLVVALADASGARIKTADGHNSLQIGAVKVKGRTHYFGAPTPPQSFSARFGETARLIGYHLAYEQRAARLTLYWHALALTQTSYTVFVHLLDANGTLRAQRDQIPGAGAYPTTSWIKGEYLIDLYDIAIPRDAPPGDYRIVIGMYDAATGARLPAFDAPNQSLGDHIVLPVRIPVAP